MDLLALGRIVEQERQQEAREQQQSGQGRKSQPQQTTYQAAEEYVEKNDVRMPEN